MDWYNNVSKKYNRGLGISFLWYLQWEKLTMCQWILNNEFFRLKIKIKIIRKNRFWKVINF